MLVTDTLNPAKRRQAAKEGVTGAEIGEKPKSAEQT
jgi:hypothetical protein